MAFKYVVFAALVAVARAGVLAPVAPLAYAAAPAAIAKLDTEYDPNPQYSYSYDVQDGLTGDSKSQSESRSGDVVQGQYSLNDADGTRRIVDYTADPLNGFNAVVRKEPLAVAAPVVTKTIAAAPVITKTVAPFAYSAPIAHAAPLAYSAPIAHAAPIAYSTGIHHAAPLTYSAPIAHAPLAYSAPIAKFATPVVHSAPLIQSAPLLRSAALSPAVVHSSFSSPYATYAI